MRAASLCFATLATFLALSDACWAHKVNVFAFVDGDEIQVECSFSRSQKVKNGKLRISDLETGNILLESVTDDRGIFRFRPSDAFLLTGHGLIIRLNAGEGHQDEWRMAAEELRALSPNARPQTPAATSGQGTTEPRAAPARVAVPAVAVALDAGQVEAIIARVVDAKLAPINQALARQSEREHDWRDIIGGIGWILGLLGLATYLKYRR